jgi:hypothetical protein
MSRSAPRWWELRRAHNRKPVTYRCPFCGQQFPALLDHMLIVPEGDASRRRHAHTECVLAARRAGRLPTRSEWQRTQSRAPGLLWRIRGRLSALRKHGPTRPRRGPGGS